LAKEQSGSIRFECTLDWLVLAFFGNFRNHFLSHISACWTTFFLWKFVTPPNQNLQTEFNWLKL